MKTKTKRRVALNIPQYTLEEAKAMRAAWAKAKEQEPKPTTLLDVWGTDVERVILEDGYELNLKNPDVQFSPRGEWFRDWKQTARWAKSADTKIAYVFPPLFNSESQEKINAGSGVPVNFGGVLGLDEVLKKQTAEFTPFGHEEKKPKNGFVARWKKWGGLFGILGLNR